MTNGIAAFILVYLCSNSGVAQEPGKSPSSAPAKATLHDIGRAIPSFRIGSPPSPESPAARVEQWQREIAAYNRAFEIVKESWTGEPAENADELRFRVGQYEDLIQAVTQSGGYGNLALADTSRRLSLFLLISYAVAHPSEYAAVGDLLGKERVRLLECQATGDMVTEELKLAAPSGKWHLSDGRDELDLVYRADGSRAHEEGGRSLLHMPVESKLMSKRDISGLLHRLVADEMVERLSLAALVEFLKRGGSLTDLKSFYRVMGKETIRFQFPPLGIREANLAYLDLLIEGVREFEGKPVPFASVIGN